MNFNHFELVIPLIAFLVIFIYFYNKKRADFFSWVKDHWDFMPSEIFKFSEYLFLISFVVLGFLFLDPRGEARKVKADVQSQKTIIMIDTSSSMLVEDVRPNRLGKAVMLAKHYVKNAIGQQISVMVFSDSYKKIVPFTTDIDLLEARINALEDLRINGGGTSLKLSIQEALQYLKIDNKTEPSGNILVLTDAEENDLKGELEISDGISLALVGIGTAKGGVIPVRDSRGIFKTNKKYNGELVVSKLNENVLKEITDKITNSEYWIASNYSIPTNEIISFFQRAQKEREKKGQVTIKPIVIFPFFIIFFICFIVGSILKIRKPIINSIFLFLFLTTSGAYAQAQKDEIPEEKPRNEDVVFLEEKLKKGELSIKEKKDLAFLYLKNNEIENAEKLYSEVPVKEDEISVRFNKNKTLLQTKKIKEGLKGLKSLKDYLGDEEKYVDIKKKINSEILTHLIRQEQEEKNSKDKKNQQENSDDKKKSGSSGQGESKDEQDKKEQKEQKEKNEQDKKDDQKKSDGNKKNKDEQEKDKKQDKQKNSRSKQRMKIKQLPALLKQLMSEDRKLQEKLLDTSTEDRGNNNQKDW